MVVLPVWATLSYFRFDFELIYFFAAYVICSNCFQLMLISFFKDGKVCSEVVSMLCSVSVFLYYLVDLENLECKILSYVGYSVPIMMLPQPGFALSIVGSSKKAASMMLLSAKLFIVIYAWREFEIHPLHHCKACINKFRSAPTQMNQELELESLDSEAKIMQPSPFNRERLLSIRNLVKKFNSFTALDGLSLTIAQGEILALLGRNGAGKTTLIDIITGMQDQTSGTVEFKVDRSELKIGVCYQQEILYEQLTVEEIVAYYVRVRRQQYDEVLRVLTLVQLHTQKSKKVKDLSGGMKRRLSLAIAIIGNPSMLILDQPTSGLDPHSRRSIWSIINKLKSEQKSILLTTHHLDQAEALSDRVCVIERGNILVLGSPMFIKKKFGIGYLLTVYGEETEREEKLVGKYVTVERQERGEGSRRYVLRMKDEGVFGRLIEELQSIQGIEVTLQLNSLEEAFMGILNDPELALPSQNSHPILLPLSRSPITSPRPFLALLLKNIYLLKHSPLKSTLLHNLNLLFLGIGIIVSNLFSKLTTSPDNPTNIEITKQSSEMMLKVMLLQGYYFSIGVYVYNAVMEKEKKIRNVLEVRGMGWREYWLAQFVIDYSLFCINLTLVYLIVGDMVNIKFMAMFGLSLIMYSYCCSHIFSSSEKAVKFFPIGNFVIGMVIPVIKQVGNGSWKELAMVVIKYVYPFYQVQNEMIPSDMMSMMEVKRQWDVMPFVVQVVGYILLLVAIEMKVLLRIRTQVLTTQSIPQPIRLTEIRKVYNNTQIALNSLSLSVQPRSILGLLGPNGAGKSTTFALLTNLLTPTSGTLHLEHLPHPPYRTTFTSSGVCYQDDTLWPLLTGSQILTVFGHLIGIENISEESLYLADNLQIETLSRKFQKLSGGNKRKLCMAVCLMGQPLSSFLDQCSTGLDPLSRRSMVHTIATHTNSTLVFTTHSMNQAQSLCKQVAILVSGSLKQYGTVKQLKDKYYPCYFVEIVCNQEETEITGVIIERFKGMRVREWQEEERKMKGEIGKGEIRLSELYLGLMEMREKGVVRDFSVYEPNLEDVYLEVIEG